MSVFKFAKFSSVAGLIVLLSACSLLPGKVEYFQKKVKPVPVAADQPHLVEAQKQAAQFVDLKVNEAKVAAASTHADVTVQVPLAEAATVSGPLFMSLGPPLRPWFDSATDLALSLDHQKASLDTKLDSYAKRTEPLEGKKIEGTGLIKIGYFTQLGLIFGVGFLIFTGLKIYGLSNPVVGAATSVAQRVGSKVLATGFHQVVAGGNKFLDLAKSKLTLEEFHKIEEMFKTAHATQQDSSIQSLVKTLSTAS